MSLSVIVAASQNNIIGVDDDLPWRLSADLKRFKSITMGHAMIMGRKTFESINRLLPGRTTIILTRQNDYHFEGAMIADSLDKALALAKEDTECFVVGGAEIYKQALPLAKRIYFTRVETVVNGDTRLPEIDWEEFELVSEEKIVADEKNEYETTFQVWDRRSV